jgi:lipopolysaccharide transport system ATP-binding protein
MNLGAGKYSIATAVVAREAHLERNHEWCDLAKIFIVINANKKDFTGCVWLEPEVTVEVVR